MQQPMSTRSVLRRRRREVARLPVCGAQTFDIAHAHNPSEESPVSDSTHRPARKGSGIRASSNALICLDVRATTVEQPAQLQPHEHEVAVFAPRRPLILGSLPTTRDPDHPYICDEPLEQV